MSLFTFELGGHTFVITPDVILMILAIYVCLKFLKKAVGVVTSILLLLIIIARVCGVFGVPIPDELSTTVKETGSSVLTSATPLINQVGSMLGGLVNNFVNFITP